MTHQLQATALDRITEPLTAHGFDGLAQAMTVLLNINGPPETLDRHL
jgi:hypothetical protein